MHAAMMLASEAPKRQEEEEEGEEGEEEGEEEEEEEEEEENRQLDSSASHVASVVSISDDEDEQEDLCQRTAGKQQRQKRRRAPPSAGGGDAAAVMDDVKAILAKQDAEIVASGNKRKRRSASDLPQLTEEQLKEGMENGTLCMLEDRGACSTYHEDLFLRPRDGQLQALVVCCVCGSFVALSGGAFTNLKQHLAKHTYLIPALQRRYENKIVTAAAGSGAQSKLTEFSVWGAGRSASQLSTEVEAGSGPRRSRKKRYHPDLVRAALQWVVSAHNSFRAIEDPALAGLVTEAVRQAFANKGLTRQLRNFDNAIELPGRMTLAPALAVEAKACTAWVQGQIQEQINSMPLPTADSSVHNPGTGGAVRLGPVNLLSDMWTSQAQKVMLGMMACFVNKDWDFVFLLLACRPVDVARHNATTMQDETAAILNEYEFPNVQEQTGRSPCAQTMVTDGAQVCKNAFEGWNITCAPHTLHLAFKLIYHAESGNTLRYHLRCRLARLQGRPKPRPDEDTQIDMQCQGLLTCALGSDDNEPEDEEEDEDDTSGADIVGRGHGGARSRQRRHAAAGADRAGAAASGRGGRQLFPVATVEECYQLTKQQLEQLCVSQIEAACDGGLDCLLRAISLLRTVATKLHHSTKETELLQQIRQQEEERITEGLSARRSTAQRASSSSSSLSSATATAAAAVGADDHEVEFGVEDGVAASQEDAEAELAARMTSAQTPVLDRREQDAPAPWQDMSTEELKKERTRLRKRVTIVLSNETRWTSTPTMLSGAMRNERMLKELLTGAEFDDVAFEDHHWDMLRVMQPFSAALITGLNYLQGDDISHASAILPTVYNLKRLCDPAAVSLHQYEGFEHISDRSPQMFTLNCVRRIILAELKRLFPLNALAGKKNLPVHQFTTLRLATLMDPRFHLNVGRFVVQSTDVDERPDAGPTVVALKHIAQYWAIALHQAEAVAESSAESQMTESAENAPRACAEGEQRVKKHAELFNVWEPENDDHDEHSQQQQDKMPEHLSAANLARRVAQEWLTMAEIIRGGNWDSVQKPLDWWKQYESSVPLLAGVARAVLAIPASSAAVERLFSAVGISMPPNRCAMNDTTIDKLMRVLYYLR